MARLSTLFAAVVALAVAPVQAASFATASLSDLTITLFDLNPADGIAPGITTPDYIGDVAFVRAQDGGNVPSSTAQGTGPFDLTVATAVSSARAVVTGTGPVNVTSLTASGSALGTLVSGGLSAYHAQASGPDFYPDSPSRPTRWCRSRPSRTWKPPPPSVSRAAVRICECHCELVRLGTRPRRSDVQSSGTLSLLAPERLEVLSALLTASFANLTGSDMVGAVFRGAVVEGQSAVLVPEPETYALMLAGLGLLAFMVRRRGRLPRA